MHKLNGNRNSEACNKIHLILDNKRAINSQICEDSDSYKMQMHNKLIYKIYSAIPDKLIGS